MKLNQWLTSRLDERRAHHLYRSLKTTESLVDFCSNDYLGLARSQELHGNIVNKVASLQLTNGATGSRLLAGNSAYTEIVEQKLAHIFQAESALIMNSGYAANLAVLSSLPQRGDTILYDELSHASLKDGARLSLANRFSFKHNNIEDLENKIKRAHGNIYVVIESVYSMDGDEAPLKEIIDTGKQHGCIIVLDEAHSTGAYGPNGSGLACKLNLEQHVDIRIYTFGKAMGCHGACVIGSNVLRDYLINFARPFIYTTALSPHSIASIDCAFEYLQGTSELQQSLRDKIGLFQSRLPENVNHNSSKSAIQIIHTPGNENARRIAAELQNQRLDVRPILSPTVPVGSERLRICLHTYNTDTEIETLSKNLGRFH